MNTIFPFFYIDKQKFWIVLKTKKMHFMIHLNKRLIRKNSRLGLYKYSSSLQTPDSNSTNNRLDKALDKGKVRLFELMSIYEEAIGLKEIKQAQQSVLEVVIYLFFQSSNLNLKICWIQHKKRPKKGLWMRKIRDETSIHKYWKYKLSCGLWETKWIA